jgi:hypothetical protein
MLMALFPICQAALLPIANADSINGTGEVSGTVTERRFSLYTKSAQTIEYNILGTVGRHGYRLTVEPRRPESQNATLRYVIAREESVTYSLTEKVTMIGPEIKTNREAFKEPFLVPRQTQEGVKAAGLTLADPATLHADVMRNPVLMTPLFEYTFTNLLITATTNTGQMELRATLRGQPEGLSLWFLKSKAVGPDSIVSHYERYFYDADTQKLTNKKICEIDVSLSITPAHLPASFKPLVTKGQVVIDFTTMDQMEFLRILDNSKVIEGASTYYVTNSDWAYDVAAVERGVSVLKKDIRMVASRSRLRTALTFLVIAAVTFSVPLLIVRGTRKKRTQTNQTNI